MLCKFGTRFLLAAVVVLPACSPVVYWTSVEEPASGKGYSIMRLKHGARQSKPQSVLSGLEFIPVGLAVDDRTNRVFWAVPNESMIRCADLGEGNVKASVFRERIAYPYRVAWDPVCRRVYWSAAGIPHSSAGKIQWASPDDPDRETHDLATGLNGPTGIALDPRPGFRRVYWVLGATGEIQSASMDEATGLTSHGRIPTSEAHDLVFHPQTRLFYWPNEGYRSVGRAELKGRWITNAEKFLLNLAESPSSLVLDPRKRALYWGYRRYNQIECVSFGKEKIVRPVATGHAAGLAIVYPHF